MTAIAAASDRTTREPGAGRRIWNVVKLHYTNRWNMFALPWIVLGIIFVLNIAIWLIIIASQGAHPDLSGTKYSGGTTYIFVYMIVVAVQAINLTFPFALGYSVTRRDYYLGTTLAFILQSAMFTVGYVFLSFVETWTNGWFLGAHLFNVVYFGGGSPLTRLFTVFALFLFCFFIGAVAATFYVRWKMNGVIALGIGVSILGVAAFAIISLSQSWAAVGSWLGGLGVVGIMAWSLVPTALAGIGGWFVLRRATPRG